ncbi:MAG: RHS repeat protein, partial [Candidatus Nealsonbacteria bacterium]|nr:RHS repeat protein [Candidatus Nealsonbacteria bacterium]
VLTVDGRLTVDGAITATGNNGISPQGGGSGGSVYVTAGTVAGAGIIAANGGIGGSNNGGGGGGGRVAMYYDDFSGFLGPIEVHGGTGHQVGEVGTIYLPGSGTPAYVSTYTRPQGFITAPVDHLDVTFIGPIDPATFTADDLRLSGPLGRIDVAGITLEDELGGQQTYRVSFPLQEADGRYTYTVGPNIVATNGKLQDQDWDGIGGEPEDDVFEATFIRDTVAPRITRQVPTGDLAGTIEHVDIWFSEEMDTEVFTPNDIRITGPDGSTIWPTDLERTGTNTFRISFEPQTAYGQYHVLIGPYIRDPAGNLMDQDRDGTPGERDDDVYDASFNVAEVDLKLSNVLVEPAELWAGESVTVSWDGANDSGMPLLGDWTDAIYLSADDQWDIDDKLLDAVAHSGGLAQDEVYSQSVDLAVPGALPGDYYVIVRADMYNQEKETDELDPVGDNIVGIPISVSVHELSAGGVAVAGTLNAADAVDYYAVELPPGDALDITLNTDGGENEVYVALGRMPSRQDFDRRAIPRTSDVRLVVPGSFSGGTHYVMTYGAGSSSVAYSLRAEAVAMGVIAWTPDEIGEAADAVFSIEGVGFTPDIAVELVDDLGNAIGADVVSVFSTEDMEATFAEGTLTAGTYDLRLSRPGSDVLVMPDAITVLLGGEAVLETQLITPSSLGFHQLGTLYVEYANTGTIAMPAPLLVVSADQNGREGAFLTLNETNRHGGFWTSAHPEGFSPSIQLLACGDTPGLLQPGESVSVPIYYAGWQQPWQFGQPFNFSLGVLTADDTSPADWSGMKDAMKPEDISAEAWDQIFASFTAEVGTTWGDYVSMLAENAAYLRRLGQPVTDVGELMAFELAQAQGYSVVGSLAGGIDAVASGPGLDIAFSRSFSESIVSRYELGTLGYGWTNNWDMSFSTRNDGTVEINYPGGSKRIFQPSVLGGYLARPDDNGTLTDRTGGGYMLRELGGSFCTFTADGKLDFVEDTNANRITCGYDAEGRLKTLSHSNGIATATIGYNAAGRIRSVTDQDDRETTYFYDAADEHLIEVVGYDGLSVGYAYNDEHALFEIAYADETHTFYEYNGLGQLDAIHGDGDAGRVEITRGDGGLVSMTDTLGGQTDCYFNQTGAIEKAVDPLGRAVEMNYDSLGNMTRMTDPLGRSTTYAYDTLGNVVRSTNALGLSTRFSYTRQLNRLNLLTDAAGNVTDYDYDAAGNLVSITYADNSLERWQYDALGNAEEWINRRGQSVQYTIDAEGRVTVRQYGLDTPGDATDDKTVNFTYDARGNLTESVDPTGTTTFTPDANDYLTRIDYPDGRFLVYTHDAAGRRESMTDELGHQTNYAYDSLGRLWQLTDESDSVIVTYSYDELYRLSRADKGNGTYTRYDYDAAGQLKSLLNYAPDDSVTSKFEYEYDGAGLRTLMTTLDGAWTYDYDVIGQLTHAVFAPAAESTLPAQNIAYEYDPLGNRLSTTINGAATEYTSNELNQYTAVGGTSYGYDADENLVQEISPEGTTTYTYNTDNKLVMVAKPDGAVYEYTYDAFGNRVAVSIDGVVTEYVIDPIGLGNVVGQYDGSTDVWQAGHSHGLGLINQTTAAGSYYYDFDALGSTAALTDALGAAVNNYAYLPFGGELAWTETVANDFQFVGQWGVMNEGNGLEFMRARYYDRTLGRFTSQDPVGLVGGMNLYRYVENDPTSLVDPLGLASPLIETTLDNTGRFYDMMKSASASQSAKLLATMAESSFFTSVASSAVIIKVTVDKLVKAGAATAVGIKATAGVLVPVIKVAGPIVIVGALIGGAGYGGAKLGTVIRDDVNEGIQTLGYWYYSGGVERVCMEIDDAIRDVLRPHASTTSNPVRSQDPNDKLGPAGYGDDGYIAVDVDQSMVMPYTIRFENKADATAPAQWIRITDAFDEDLDLTTFELTEFMLGGEIFAIPAGLDSYNAQLERTIEGHELVVEVAISLDRAARTLSASFMALDPTTGWMPENPMIGLLYPNDDNGRGDGHISYTIEPLDGLATGTEITNKASIFFDWNDPIDTPQVLNTIDAGFPTSSVDPLPDNPPGSSVPVTWSGEDDAGGSGVAHYDIHVSDNEGPFELWLDDTTETSATFHGKGGHTYAFYSVATDNVGHREPAPETPDGQTTLQTEIIDRQIFYNGSIWDWDAYVDAGDLNGRYDPGEDGPLDDLAIATDKESLRPGGIATFENYTSYSRGINGIMVDIAGLANPAGLTAENVGQYVEFNVGNSDDPGAWASAPGPVSVTVAEGGGPSGTDRVKLIWEDHAIQNTWLEVTILANVDTGLAAPDVFYIGNAVAEAGNSQADAQVTTTDLLLARNNPRGFPQDAAIDFPYDYDRDGQVNATDVLLARNNQTSFFNALKLIDLTDGAEEAQATPLADLAWLTDLDQPATHRPAEKDGAAKAVDQLLATYWP